MNATMSSLDLLLFSLSRAFCSSIAVFFQIQVFHFSLFDPSLLIINSWFRRVINFVPTNCSTISLSITLLFMVRCYFLPSIVGILCGTKIWTCCSSVSLCQGFFYLVWLWLIFLVTVESYVFFLFYFSVVTKGFGRGKWWCLKQVVPEGAWWNMR